MDIVSRIVAVARLGVPFVRPPVFLFFAMIMRLILNIGTLS